MRELYGKRDDYPGQQAYSRAGVLEIFDSEEERSKRPALMRRGIPLGLAAREAFSSDAGHYQFLCGIPARPPASPQQTASNA
ncbi:hypothetical protein [Paraburkholderia sp. 40]|uniref:hypothetical protein n=1 Tax=unclassified Paraburkholderia TaxID=2615204 RepID=UPI003D23A6A4